MSGIVVRARMPRHGNVEGREMERQRKDVQPRRISAQETAGHGRHTVGIREHQRQLIVAGHSHDHSPPTLQYPQRIIDTAMKSAFLGNHDVAQLAILVE